MANSSELFNDGKKTASCFDVQTWAKLRKLTVGRDCGRAGDLALFDWNANAQPDHIGFILSQNENGTYQTLEGNTSASNNSNGGEVQIRTRPQSTIMMIIRPEYAPEVALTPAPVKEMTNVELPVLREGDSNKSVHAAMVLMKEKGYYPYTIPSWDNKFGEKMKAGLLKMQKEHGLGADGILGNASWTFLLK